MDEIVINIQPFIDIITIIALIILLGVIAFLFHNFKGLNLFSKHDNSVIDKFLSKYPDVSPEFIKKDTKAQNVENNQEIHEVNKRIDAIEANQAMILQILEELKGKEIL
jgi:peroxiredoxin family protein